MGREGRSIVSTGVLNTSEEHNIRSRAWEKLPPSEYLHILVQVKGVERRLER